MSRIRTPLWLLLAVCVLAAPVGAEEPKKEASRPTLDSDEDVAAALAEFKVAFKAKGLKGDFKIARQAHLLRELADFQHAKIIQALGKATKHRTIEVRTEAVLQLGKQRALPADAGKAVLEAMKRNEKDHTFTMSGLEAIGALGYLGAQDKLKELMKHPEYAVVKNALATVGKLKDSRLLEEIIKLMKKLKLEKGAKWDGVSVSVDTGAAGNKDQKAAEAKGKAQQNANRAKGKGAARSMRDLGPIVLDVARELTGQSFSGSIAARKWVDKNKKHVDELYAQVDEREKEQAKAAP